MRSISSVPVERVALALAPLLFPLVLLGAPETPFVLLGVMRRFVPLFMVAIGWGALEVMSARWVAPRIGGAPRSRGVRFGIAAAVLVVVLFELLSLHLLRRWITSEEFTFVILILGARGLALGMERGDRRGETEPSRGVKAPPSPIATQGEAATKSRRFNWRALLPSDSRLSALATLFFADLLVCALGFRLYLLAWEWQGWALAGVVAALTTAVRLSEEVERRRAEGRSSETALLGKVTAILFVTAPLLCTVLYYFGELPRRFALVILVLPLATELLGTFLDPATRPHSIALARESRRFALLTLTTLVFLRLW